MNVQDLFLADIERQCKFAVIAYNGLVSVFQSGNLISSDRYKREESLVMFWFYLQAFLVAAGNISKILWPSELPKCKKCNFQDQLSSKVISRGVNLRNLLSIKESSLLKHRKFRNYFEHYDFYIQEWHEKSRDRVLIDSNISVIDYPAGRTPGSVAYMRNFDPDRFVLTFRNKEYKINDVLYEIKQLLEKIETLS